MIPHKDEKFQFCDRCCLAGVYGDWSGNWVDEDSVPQPTENRAIARLKAENAWLQLAQLTGVAVHIFRLGGIYGPGRRSFVCSHHSV
jgi:nucleoside-diphosphate-sugar epimerase